MQSADANNHIKVFESSEAAAADKVMIGFDDELSQAVGPVMPVPPTEELVAPTEECVEE